MFCAMSAGNPVERKKILRNMLWCAAIALVYAVSDELHQLFSPGRSCQIKDMLIDFCGASAGIAAVNSIRLRLHRRKI